MRIRILGAGVAGLAAACALGAAGHEVELVDEAFAIPAVGTSLGLFGSGRRALERIGVLDRVREVSALPREGRLVTAGGRVLARVPAGDTLLVARSDLVRILQESLPAAVVRTLRRAEGPEDVEHLRAGADVLVGADGVHSPVRRALWPGDTAARRHRTTILRGTAEIAPPEIAETWGAGWLVGITPLPGGRTNWFAAHPEHRSDTVEQALEHLRELVGGRRAPIDAVLDAATPEATLIHGIRTAPPVRPVRGRTVLIGDAAHAMAPNLGHGANTALQDAVALAQALDRIDGTGGAGTASTRAAVPGALRSYERRRVLPGQAWRIGSAAMARLASAERTAPLRDRAIGALGAVARR
ncbi:FAD-dependent monooxygenase [Brachybacterium sp. DNPG3]